MRVKEICKINGMTLKQLADKMGVPPESLSRAISDKGNPTHSTMLQIAAALDVPITDLFDRPIPPPTGTITCPNCGTEIKLTAEKV